MKNKFLFVSLAVISIIIGFVLGNINTKNYYENIYSSQLSLTSYLAEKLNYTGGGGRGTIFWNYSEKTRTSNYIECNTYFDSISVYPKCREGIVMWDIPFDSKTITWIK